MAVHICEYSFMKFPRCISNFAIKVKKKTMRKKFKKKKKKTRYRCNGKPNIMYLSKFNMLDCYSRTKMLKITYQIVALRSLL